MKKLITLLILGTAIQHLHAQSTCATAVDVSPGITAVTFNSPSEVPTPICTTGQNNTPMMGAWYTYTPAELHTVVVSTQVTGYPNVDTRIHIYSGSCDSLICVAGDDDSGDNWSSIASFTANPGTTYYIAFDNNWSSSLFHFSLSEEEFVQPMFESQSIGIAATCVADMNGDYLDDIVSAGEGTVSIFYQAANDSGFTQATLTAPLTENMPSWSIAAGDYDKNGYNDLLYGGANGATLMLANDEGNAFDTKLESTQYVFSQRTNFIDINNDGHLDAFVCHDVEPNVYFLNDGDSGFTFHQGGLGNHSSGGNYGSIWVDYDNDGDSDLFIAKCRGGSNNPAAIDELHRNDGNGQFTAVASAAIDEANMADMQQSWSSAWADFDNDGDMDAFVGASSDANGEHRLKRNNGDGTFTDVTEGSGFDTNVYLNIENIAHDFNNDGWVDVFGGGHKIMINNGDMTFTPLAVTAGNGPVGDLNNDGFLDIHNGNVNYLNTGNDNNWIKIHLQGIESNRNGIGARVEVYTSVAGLEKQIRDVRSGDGFRYMSSLNTHFGLGTAESIDKVVVKWPSGTVDTILNPDTNSALMVVEGEHFLGNIGFNNGLFTLYPNPVKENLHIEGNDELGISRATIYDISGRLVKTVAVTNNIVPVATLSNGTYIIALQDAAGNQYTSKFIKE
jgi:hypothetical protein